MQIFISHQQKLHFENLLNSGINKNIYISGNTVVDAISLVPNFNNRNIIDGIDISKEEYILTTIHRRENWGSPIERIAKGISEIFIKIKILRLILPLHKNPLVRESNKEKLGHYENVF